MDALLNKSDSKDFFKDFIYCKINAVLLNFWFKESWKKSITGSTNILSRTTVFNIDNNKNLLLSSK